MSRKVQLNDDRGSKIQSIHSLNPKSMEKPLSVPKFESLEDLKDKQLSNVNAALF